MTPAAPHIMNVSYVCPITTKVAPPRYSGSRERGREIYCATPKMTVWGVARPRRRNDGWTDGRPRTNTQTAVYFSPPSIHVVDCSRNRPPSPQGRRGRDRRSWSLLTFSLCLPELTISPIPLYCRIHPSPHQSFGPEEALKAASFRPPFFGRTVRTASTSQTPDRR